MNGAFKKGQYNPTGAFAGRFAEPSIAPDQSAPLPSDLPEQESQALDYLRMIGAIPESQYWTADKRYRKGQ